MRSESPHWIPLISLTLLVITAAPEVARGDECRANVEHITFLNTPGGAILDPALTLVLFEGVLECVDLVVDNRTLATAGSTLSTIQAFDGTTLSDSIVFFNANDGPKGAALNICFWSDDDGTGTNGGSTCDPMGKVIAAPDEVLSAGLMTDTITGTEWSANLFSDPLTGSLPVGCRWAFPS